MPTLTNEAAVEQLINLLSDQKRALELHGMQITKLMTLDRPPVISLVPLKNQVGKIDIDLQKLRDVVTSLDKNAAGAYDEFAQLETDIEELQAQVATVQQRQIELNADLVLFWRMTFLERFAWLLGGAHLFGRAAKFLIWWRKPWRH